MISRSQIRGTRKKALSGLEGLLETVSLEMMLKSVELVHTFKELEAVSSKF